MFGRGNWAILGINSESKDAFVASLQDTRTMLASSQFAAAAITRFQKRDSFGINPFRKPRLDEDGHNIDLEALATFATSDEDTRAAYNLGVFSGAQDAFAADSSSFELSENSGLYGFWMVLNTWKDVSHAASLREELAYENFVRPTAFLNATDKKSVTTAIHPITASIRKQFPVLIDFNRGRVYVETTSKSDILNVQDLLAALGAEVIAVGFKYNVTGHWPSKFLTQVWADTSYTDEFQKYAEETHRFPSSEIAKLDNLEMQKIVSKFFAADELETEIWVGLSGPAAIKLHPTSAPITAGSPASATTLLAVTGSPTIQSACVTFQERKTSYNKKTDSERIFRTDLLTFDMSDAINLVDVGAAILRGFDIPSFKRDIMKEIRKTKQVPPLARFWSDWVIQMGNAVQTIESTIADVLDIGKVAPYGIQPVYTGGSDDVVEEGD